MVEWVLWVMEGVVDCGGLWRRSAVLCSMVDLDRLWCSVVDLGAV